MVPIIPLGEELGLEDDCIFRVRREGQTYRVVLRRDSRGDTIEHEYHQRINAAIKEKNEEMIDSITDDLYNIICFELSTFYPPNSSPERTEMQTLQAYVPTEELGFEFCTRNENLGIQRSKIDGRPSPFGLLLRNFNCNINVYSASSVKIISTLQEGRIFKVSHGTSIMCAKLAGFSPNLRQLKREIDVLNSLSQVTLPLHVPKLLGLVRADDSDSVIGFLMDYINDTEPLSTSIEHSYWTRAERIAVADELAERFHSFIALVLSGATLNHKMCL
jgi:hypothetical protein